jgi:hypothetical protein
MEVDPMERIKKLTLAALFTLALAAGGLAVGAGAEQFASSNPKSFGHESASLQVTPDEPLQVAGSAGERSKHAGRESS